MADSENEALTEQHFLKGEISPAGVRNERGELLPRATPEPRMGLSMEDEYTIDMWNKQIKRDFPKLDESWIDMISTYCHKHPEESRAYALENANKNPADKTYRALPHDKYKAVNI